MPFNKYVKLPGSAREPLPGASKSGSVDPNQLMQVTLMLRPRSRRRKHPSLDQLIASGQHIPREEYAARYGADPADVQKVGQFAAANGLAIAQINLAARSVILTGKAADFCKAFQVELAQYDHPGGSYRGRTGSISLPNELNKVVTAVMGLDDRPQAQTHFRLANSSANPSAAAVSYTALQVAQAYSFPTTGNGKG